MDFNWFAVAVAVWTFNIVAVVVWVIYEESIK